MTRSLLEILESSARHTDALTTRLKALMEENEQLRSQVADLDDRLAQASAERDRALRDVEYLTLSHRLADNPEALVSARREVARMIRVVDRCITLLKDDPQL